ncbi:MAG: hypothetical protein ACKVT0_17095, partial [Planctomycetaceae bacterium]
MSDAPENLIRDIESLRRASDKGCREPIIKIGYWWQKLHGKPLEGYRELQEYFVSVRGMECLDFEQMTLIKIADLLEHHAAKLSKKTASSERPTAPIDSLDSRALAAFLNHRDWTKIR